MAGITIAKQLVSPLAYASSVNQQHRFVREHGSQGGEDVDGVQAAARLLSFMLSNGYTRLCHLCLARII
jgi:hypothetical protein